MLNTITILGRLTRDPELRRTGSGVPVASFSVAVDRDYKPDGGERETDFIDCVAWRQTGEFVSKYFQKGSLICVTGRLQIRSWTADDGSKRRSAEINVASAYFAGAKNSGSQGSSEPDDGFDPANPYANSLAMANAYLSQQQGRAPASDFAMLEDDDNHFPF